MAEFPIGTPPPALLIIVWESESDTGMGPAKDGVDRAIEPMKRW
jgi:hypothetical protein